MDISHMFVTLTYFFFCKSL